MTISEKDRDTLIRYRIEQAHEAIEEAELSISHNKLKMAVNRIYYGMFYILSALALKYRFKTSKHQGLIGWFNKNFLLRARPLVLSVLSRVLSVFIATMLLK